MEPKMKVTASEVLMEPLLSFLEEAESVPLGISGSSMTPFLAHGRDTVYLSKVTRPLKRGDMILYRRDSGAYILHRIWKAEGATYCLVGDAQTAIEAGVRRDQVLAIVTAVCRKGKLLKKGSFWWMFFEKIWLGLISARPVLVRAYSFLTGKTAGRDAHD